MSDTESEVESQSVGDDSTTAGFRQCLEPSKLDQHLLRKGVDRPVPSDADTVKSAVEILSRKMTESDLEDDDALNLRLARAAQTISNFLDLANLTISTEEQYNMLPSRMRGELVEALDMILSEVFLNKLFLLRQQIRHVAIKRERIVSHQMVTLSDVVIAAIIDYTSCSASNAEEMKAKNEAKYPTIELAIRLPQCMDSLANFLASPILSIEPHLNLQVKSGALAVLYCSRCLNPSTDSPQKDLTDCLSSFWLCSQLDQLPDLAIAHFLCVYMVSCVNFTDELHPFRPATNSALWKLLIELFPETALISQEPLKPGQKVFFFHGALLMPWIWWNRSLCPVQDSNWVGMITLLWIVQEYSWLNSNSNGIKPLLSKMIPYSLEGSETISRYSRVVKPLLGNHAIGLRSLIKMKEDRNYSDDLGTTDSSPDYITLVMLQVYSALWGSPTVMLSVEEKDEIGVQIEKIIQIEIYRSFESSAPFDVIDMTLSLSPKAFERLIQGLQIKLPRLLESLLLEIEISADRTHSQQEVLSHQRRALGKSMLLTKCLEIRPLEHLVKSSVINLVNILVTPLRCDHTIALAVTKLILCISNSVKEGKALTSQQLQTVSDALIEVMADCHEATVKQQQVGEGLEAGPLTADFIKHYCSQFDYQMTYPLEIFGALREELANEFWSHLGTQLQNEQSMSSSDGPNQGSPDSRSGVEIQGGSRIMIATGMHALFTRFSDLQRKFVQASPLTRELLLYLKSNQEEVIQKLVVMLSMDE